MNRPHVWALACGIGALVLFGAAWAAPAGGEGGMAKESISETCAACHDDQVAAFARNPHAVLDSAEWLSKDGFEGSCTACHGDATQHLEEGGGTGSIFAFGDDALAAVKTQHCLTCHGDVHPRFLQSPHAAAGLDCTSCHSVHSPAAGAPVLLKVSHSDRGGMLQVGAKSAVCAQCHADVFSLFSFNERHRLQEGVLDCTTCHNPHAPASRLMLGGFKQEQCIDCHADKGGPFVFEHGSVRVEGCTACHNPHGSPNRHQLLFQRTAELCFSCHATVPSFHSRFTLDTQCTNCHSSIHGSNFSPFFLQ
jgi:DmsE family decaheme c-type cytochrome